MIGGEGAESLDAAHAFKAFEMTEMAHYLSEADGQPGIYDRQAIG